MSKAVAAKRRVSIAMWATADDLVAPGSTAARSGCSHSHRGLATGAKLRFGIVALFSLLCVRAVQAEVQYEKAAVSEAATKSLRQWFELDLHFFSDERGSPKLFLRRQPVKVAILADPFPIKEEVNYLIARLSDAAGVAHETTASDVNLAIVVGSPINDGDRPDARLWKRVGLSDSMYQIVSAQGKWSSGCGIYSFANKGGDASLSIVFADSKLGMASVRDCVIEGVIRGFGLRQNRKLVLRADDGYIQYITLARALSACERRIGIARLFSMSEVEQRSKYVGCVSELLGRL